MDEKLYLPLSIVFSALVLAGTIFFVGADVSSKMTGLATALGSIELGSGSGSDSGGNLAPEPTPQQPTPSAVIDMQELADDDPAKGSTDAPVTIIEFSDFQCPFCGRFYDQALSQIQSEYIDTGKVKLIYRDFPLSSIHPEAQPAAEAAECANEQGKFWEMHNKIFENQDSMSAASYKQWAAELGLNTTQFNSCLDTSKYEGEVLADFSDGSNAGGSGTPTFFINGQKIVGAQPFSSFKAVIDAELS
ncbi:MAG: DsbA family protein [Candidatus Diapherotrites archaeon]|uniref:DsbA family protein n=1 Tax=Candidatus Iainarchaeum sp. TaxID=3101447 RepID=A0A8T4KXQ6_9ARCH|nr:DsbA family protein [Candidatus Diapherotrites archaeon]